VCACARACVRARVCIYIYICVCVYVYILHLPRICSVSSFISFLLQESGVKNYIELGMYRDVRHMQLREKKYQESELILIILKDLS